MTMKQRKSFGSICAIACAAATIITFVSCSQEDEYYESDMFTRAESASDLSRLEAPPAYIPDKQNCGLWVLANLGGASMETVKAIAETKGWEEGDRLTNFLVFDIAQQLHGLSTHVQGPDAWNALIRFSSTALPSKIIIYTDEGEESHMAKPTDFQGSDVIYEDYSGPGKKWSIYRVFGVMY